MKPSLYVVKILACCAFITAGAALAQIPPVGVQNQTALLKSSDAKLAANKQLVFDMYRAIVNGGHYEMAEKFFTKEYIQHNPNVASGRDALVAFIKQSRPVRPLAPTISFPLISIVAEGDMVVVATVSTRTIRTSPARATPPRTSTCIASRMA